MIYAQGCKVKTQIFVKVQEQASRELAFLAGLHYDEGSSGKFEDRYNTLFEHAMVSSNIWRRLHKSLKLKASCSSRSFAGVFCLAR